MLNCTFLRYFIYLKQSYEYNKVKFNIEDEFKMHYKISLLA